MLEFGIGAALGCVAPRRAQDAAGLSDSALVPARHGTNGRQMPGEGVALAAHMAQLSAFQTVWKVLGLQP